MTIDIIIVICLVLLGVALMMAEIFLLPGTTVAAIGATIMLVGSVVYAFYYIGNTAGYITVVANAVLGVGSFVFLIKSKTLDHIALNTNIDAIVDQPEIAYLSVGQEGLALSRLNPIGKAEFDNKHVTEVKSVTGEFIDADSKIEIVSINKRTVLVQEVKKEKKTI